LGALVVSAAAAACANLPTSGSVRANSLQGAGGAGQIGVQIVPVPPGRAWRPQDIVNGFLAASASYDHTVAREYLTGGKNGYARRWRPGWAATIIDSPKVSQVQSNVPPNLQKNGQPLQAQVLVTGRHIARLQTTGRYQAGSVVVAPASTQFRFGLEQVSGQWRIDSIDVNGTKAPANLLLLTRSDFERDYQPRNLYFYAPGNASKSLIPDPVYIPQQAGSKGLSGLVKGLVETLLTPQPDASWLYGAATSAFPRGTVLLGPPQVVGGIRAVVNLGGAAAKASPSQRQRMAAQLYWSLKASPYPTQAANPIQSVVLRLNGRQVPQLSPTAYERYLPRGLAAPLYYQVPSSPTGPAVVMRASATQQVPVSLPKQLGSEPFGTIAASTAPIGWAVVAGCSGKTVYLMPQSHSKEVVPKRLPSECTSLSWDDNGNLWIAARTQIFVIHAAETEPPARPALVPVYVPRFTHAMFQALRVAPDGVRVALIVRTGSTTKIQVAAISKSTEGTNFTYLAQTGHTLRVGSDVAHPLTLTWLDPNHLLVLGKVGMSRTQLFEVPLNGGKSTEVPVPHGVTSVAASGPSAMATPRIVVAIAPTETTPGKIEMSKIGPPNPIWQPLVKGISPVFPG